MKLTNININQKKNPYQESSYLVNSIPRQTTQQINGESRLEVAEKMEEKLEKKSEMAEKHE